MGRPSIFTQELADTICSLIAEGKSLRKICALDAYPHISTVLDWVLKGSRGVPEFREFSEQYALAREMQAETLVDEIIDIADDDSEDELFTDEGKRVMNSEFIQRSRIKIDARKWYAGKVKPKKYGDKTTTEITGKDGGPIETINMSDNERKSRIAELLGKVGAGGAITTPE